ncbi:MAG: hypothetical protein FWC94_07800 [Bacteroidales bacterium]|nr:hypothetical protein [Bacteroidales bacterium]
MNKWLFWKNTPMGQYALEGINQPTGISEYGLSNLLPENYKLSLPSIEEIEEGLNEID